MKLHAALGRFSVALAAAALLAFAPLSVTHVYAQDANQQQLTVAQTAKSLDITVFNDGFAQVEETRQVQLHAGLNRIQLQGVASQYRQDSLRIISVKGPSDFNLKSASYEPASLTNDRILQKSIGQQVSATIGSGINVKWVSGTLTAVDNGRAVITDAAGKVYMTASSEIMLDKLPAGLSATASLVVEAEVAKDGTYDINLVYETDGLNWTATHSLVLDQKKHSIDTYDVTVNVVNSSGTSFQNANLWLLSGSVQQYNGGARMYAAGAPAPASAFKADAATVTSVGEKKVYHIKGQVTLLDGQSRQFPLYAGKNVPAQTEFYLPATGYSYGFQPNGQESVNVRLKLKNCDENNMGMPLPAGAVKVYERNGEGTLQLTANSSLGQLARDQEFSLEIGTSSDIKAERTLAKVGQETRVGDAAFQDRTFNVKVYNYKMEAVDVQLEASVPAEQDDVKPLVKKNATTGGATIHVDKNTNNTFSYTLKIKTRTFNN